MLLNLASCPLFATKTRCLDVVVGEHLLQDGSTMLIEAAKGGHVHVVNLLLDWSANTAGSQTSNSPVEPTQAASPSQLYPLDFEQVNKCCPCHALLLIADLAEPCIRYFVPIWL